MSEKVINILKHEDGIETVIVEFGLGKIGIGLLSESESQRNMVVRLQELNEAKDVGAFLTAEERDDNFKNVANPLEVVLDFPNVNTVPDNDRIVLAVKDRCHFICFYDNGNFWDSSQK